MHFNFDNEKVYCVDVFQMHLKSVQYCSILLYYSERCSTVDIF